MEPLKIYADFNGLIFDPITRKAVGVVLDTFGTLRDLSNAGIVLKEGLPLIACDASDEIEDLEGQGVAHFDDDINQWTVKFDLQGIRDVPAGDRSKVQLFLCVTCRTDLYQLLESNEISISQRCPYCRKSILRPLERPNV